MKYLEFPELGLLASMLSNSSHSIRVTTRIEAYSCKSVASERKLMKSLDQEFTTDLELSTSSSSPDGLPSHSLESAFGRLDRKDCRKTFWLLIATLNAAYPDHNFSRIKVEDFQAESAPTVLMKISEALELDRSGSNLTSTLGALSTSPECIPKDSPEPAQASSLGHSLLAGIHPLVGQFLDPVIDLGQCEVYSYSPDPDSDPHAVVSDDDEDIESVASSIYRSNSHHAIQDTSSHLLDDTMWEIEDVEAPLYIHSDTIALPSAAYNLPTRTISKPPSPSDSHPIFSRMSERLGRSNSQLECGLDCPMPPLCGLSSSCDTNVEEESSGGLLWSSHYFFYNRKMKRILFISTWGRKALMASMMDESWMGHQARHGLDYLSSCFGIPASTFGQGSSWESPALEPAESSSSQLPSSHKRHLSSNLSSRLESSQPFKRTVDTSASTSSLSLLSRPLKKKRSKRIL